MSFHSKITLQCNWWLFVNILEKPKVGICTERNEKWDLNCNTFVVFVIFAGFWNDFLLWTFAIQKARFDESQGLCSYLVFCWGRAGRPFNLSRRLVNAHWSRKEQEDFSKVLVLNNSLNNQKKTIVLKNVQTIVQKTVKTIF
jgi:hypothetical protein